MNVITINSMDCYSEDGIAYLNLDEVARGLNFIKMECSGKLVMDTERIKKYLSVFDMDSDAELPEYIPAYIFCELASHATSASAGIFADNMKNIVIPKLTARGV